MPLMIDNPKYRYRPYMLTHEQAKVCVFALANLGAELSMNKDPQLVQLRADALKLWELLTSYRWEKRSPP